MAMGAVDRDPAAVIVPITPSHQRTEDPVTGTGAEAPHPHRMVEAAVEALHLEVAPTARPLVPADRHDPRHLNADDVIVTIDVV